MQQKLKGIREGYRQNRQFENNQRQFYKELDQEEERCDDDQPVAEELKQFWGNIWSQSADHKKYAKWLQEVNVKKHEKIDITTGSLKKILGRMANWKSPSLGLVQGFWLKNFSNFQERVNQHENTHKLCHETGHPAFGLLESLMETENTT